MVLVRIMMVVMVMMLILLGRKLFQFSDIDAQLSTEMHADHGQEGTVEKVGNVGQNGKGD
jgi:hypothetical protein